MSEYHLVTELNGHSAYVQAVCVLRGKGSDEEIIVASGSFDNIVKIWKSSTNMKSYEVILDQKSHAKAIKAIVLLPDKSGFVTGSSDGTLRVFTLDGTFITAVPGHSQAVVSLSFTTSGLLISGGFDGTAKLWKISDDKKSIKVMKAFDGLEHAISVLGLPGDLVATASTGFRQATGIQHATLRLFNKAGKVIATLAEHTSSIRGLAIHPDEKSFFSCGNDGKVVQYSMAGKVLKTFQSPVGYEGVPGFIYSIDIAANGDVLASCDDFCARVFKQDGTVEVIPHPKNVWTAKFLPNGDIITGAGDPIIRVFSKDDNRRASDETIAAYLTHCDASLTETRNAEMKQQELDPKKYPKIEDMHNFFGSQEGENKMFNVSGKVWLYQWSVATASWVAIGECVGAKVDKTIDGVEYDTVIDIELESQTAEGLRKLRFGINDNDNPYAVGIDFCNKHMIPLDQVQAIVDHVQMKRGKVQTQPNQQQPMDVVDAGFTPKFITRERSTGFVYETGKVATVCAKIREFNGVIPNEESKLTTLELQTLAELETMLKETSRYHVSMIPANTVELFKKLYDCWDLQHLFPVFDLLRFLLVHPQSIASFGRDGLNKFLVQTMKCVAKENDFQEWRVHVTLTALKVFANAFNTTDGTSYLVIFAADPAMVGSLLGRLEDTLEVDNKNVRSTLATVLVNYANALSHAERVIEDANFVINKLALQILPKVIALGETIPTMRCIMAIGCSFLTKWRLKQQLTEGDKSIFSEFNSCLKKISEDEDAQLVKLVAEITELYNLF